MSDAGSPFLGRDSKQDWNRWIAWDAWRQPKTYRDQIIPSEYSQRLKIETYRYRLYQRAGTLGHVMQTLGDVGRRYQWIAWAFSALYLLRWMGL
jgi:hypothetical protein